MAGIAQVGLKFDFRPLMGSVDEYAKLTGKEPGAALQRHGKNLQVYTTQEFKKERPSKTDISFEALVARKRSRKARSGKSGRAYEFNKADLEQGKLLGLKIRSSVVADARSKFGQASSLKPKARAKAKSRYEQKGTRTRVSNKKTRRYQGKDLNLTAYMIAREIAVRRSGIGYLAYGMNVSKFRKGDTPVTRKVSHYDRYRRFASKIEMIVQPEAAQFRLHGRVPGTKKVGEKRDVFKRGAQRAQEDIKVYLVGRAKANKARAFSGRRARR